MRVPYTFSDNDTILLSSGDEQQESLIQPKPTLMQEFGIGTDMPFSIPYSGPRAGSEQLYETLRPLGEDQGPSVTQLEAMRRTDGQARALYRLITQPIKSALKNAKVISSAVADAQANGIQQGVITPSSLPLSQLAAAQKAGALKGASTQQPSPGQLLADKAPVAATLEDDGEVVELANNVDRNATPTDLPDAGDEEAKFIQQMLLLPPSAGGMQISFKRVIAQMLMAIFDGFAPFELVYWVPKTGPLKGKYTLQKMAYRPANTITFLTDKNGTYAGIRQRTFFQGRTIDEKIDAENCVYYAANEEERPFYGVSYFQSAFYHYDKKVKLYYIAHLAAQRAATGTRVGTMPANAGATNILNFQKALADLGVAQYITLPSPEWKVDVLRDGANFDFMTYINHHNSQMSKSVLATFFDQSQGSGHGESTITSSRATNGQQAMTDMFVAMLKAIMDDIADVINNQLIPKFIDWNFKTPNYPKFVWGNFTDDQSSAIRDTFDKLATAGTQSNVTPEFMRALEMFEATEMGLDIDYTAVAVREAEEDAEQKAMQAQIAMGGSGPGMVGGQAKPGMPGTAPGGLGNGNNPPPAISAAGQPPPAGSAAAVLAKAKGSALSTSPKVGFTEEDEDFLMSLANQLLDAARVSV